MPVSADLVEGAFEPSVDRMTSLVCRALHDVLKERRSSLATGMGLDAGLEQQVSSIVAEIFRQLTNGPGIASPVAVEYGSNEELAKHGKLAASLDVDPSEPLMAAELLFDILLDVVGMFRQFASVGATAQARIIHREIWRRFPPGAIAYVRALRTQLSESHREGELAVTRRLHDEVAQHLVVGLQSVDVAILASGETDQLRLARDAISRSLKALQELSVSIRGTQSGQLEDALRAAIKGRTNRVHVQVASTGAARPLTGLVVQELMAFVLEAIRNAEKHAHDLSTLTLKLQWSREELCLVVENDGIGTPLNVTPGTKQGVVGMLEQARRLGASVQFQNLDDRYVVQLSLPLSYANVY